MAPPIHLVGVDSAKIASLAGAYRDGKESIVVAPRGDGLEVRQPFHEAVPLLPTADDVFMTREGTRFTFRGTPQDIGEVVRTPTAWPSTGDPVTLHRVRADAPSDPD